MILKYTQENNTNTATHHVIPLLSPSAAARPGTHFLFVTACRRLRKPPITGKRNGQDDVRQIEQSRMKRQKQSQKTKKKTKPKTKKKKKNAQ